MTDRVQKVNDLYDEDGKEIYEENRESSTCLLWMKQFNIAMRQRKD